MSGDVIDPHEGRCEGDCTVCDMPPGFHIFGCPNIPEESPEKGRVRLTGFVPASVIVDLDTGEIVSHHLFTEGFTWFDPDPGVRFEPNGAYDDDTDSRLVDAETTAAARAIVNDPAQDWPGWEWGR